MTVKELMKSRVATISGLVLILTLTSVLSGLPSVMGQGARGEQDQQRPEVIKVNTALVTVPVVVTDRYGQFVSGLSRNDFRMQENGEPQQIASFSSAEAPFNVAILIDASPSTRNKLGAIRKAALNFIKQLPPNDPVLNCTQRCSVILAVFRRLQLILVNLAQPGRNRTHFRRANVGRDLLARL